MRKKIFNFYSSDVPRMVRERAFVSGWQISKIFDDAIERAWKAVQDCEKSKGSEDFIKSVKKAVYLGGATGGRAATVSLGTAISLNNYRRLKWMSHKAERDMKVVVETAIRIYCREVTTLAGDADKGRVKCSEPFWTPALPITGNWRDFTGGESGKPLTYIADRAAVFLDWTVVLPGILTLGDGHWSDSISKNAADLLWKCASRKCFGFMTTLGVSKLANILGALAPNPEAAEFSDCPPHKLGDQFKKAVEKRVARLLLSNIRVLGIEPIDLREASKFVGTDQFDAAANLSVASRLIPGRYALATASNSYDQLAGDPNCRFVLHKPWDIIEKAPSSENGVAKEGVPLPSDASELERDSADS